MIGSLLTITACFAGGGCSRGHWHWRCTRRAFRRLKPKRSGCSCAGSWWCCIRRRGACGCWHLQWNCPLNDSKIQVSGSGRPIYRRQSDKFEWAGVNSFADSWNMTIRLLHHIKITQCSNSESTSEGKVGGESQKQVPKIGDWSKH